MTFAQIPMLKEDSVRELVSHADAIRICEETFAEYGRLGNMLSDPPAMLVSPASDGAAIFKVKGSRLPERGLTGFRIIADRYTDAGEITNDYCWIAEAYTGRVLGLVEETPLHRLRTAMTGVVAAKWLGRPGSKVATIIGAGNISEEVPGGLATALDLDEVRIVSRRFETAQAFAARHKTVAPMVASRSVDEALDGADIVIAISTATEPVVEARHLQPGMLVCGLGGGHEISAETMLKADRFIADDLTYALTIGSVRHWHHEEGVAIDTLKQRLSADVGDIATGRKPGRTSDDETIVAIIQGMACCDLAIAAYALQKAGIDISSAP